MWEQKSVMTSLPEMPSVNEFSPILKRLMLNAEKNLDRLPKQRCHDVLMKKFATTPVYICWPIVIRVSSPEYA